MSNSYTIDQALEKKEEKEFEEVDGQPQKEHGRVFRYQMVLTLAMVLTWIATVRSMYFPIKHLSCLIDILIDMPY